MNARYALKDTPVDIGQHFDVPITDNFPARYNIAPSQPVSVIIGEGGKRKYEIVRWGFVPAWDKEGKWMKKPMINIRSETAHEKPMFRHAWRRRHCLFPLNGFYEWRTERGVKQPYLITTGADMPLFALAGLYEDWLGADGSEIRTAAFLTRASEGPVAKIHGRTPVVVRPEDYPLWLDVDETDDTPAWDIVRAPQADYVFWPVDRKVGSWKSEGEYLVRPIEEGELRSEEAPPPLRTRLL
ncbi:SOS response-associated peptidase [Parvularcula sp. ZS-1/3]|uniref:Abasic site processing protein n=1 Tax=Parvularcula mediterranea TaxID=2732508 RepID=A0A7Y3W6J1_9PROT|nr:SOS response-associated peptidase [Parvularcula mediterranea]NNU17603.1 SOS response-associated peptidase [Parvularcula mediterranea]